MRQADIDFLEANRHHHTALVQAGIVRHLDGNTRSEIQRIIGEYWRKGYTADIWCSPCCADMLRLCYKFYDDYLNEKTK